MSGKVWVRVRRGDAVACDKQDLLILSKLGPELHQLSRELSVTPLFRFFDDAVPNATLTRRSSAKWFDASAGLHTVTTILSTIRGNPQMFLFPNDPYRSGWRNSVLKELDVCRSTLVEAAKADAQFHFARLRA